jgi:hypothetical protein
MIERAFFTGKALYLFVVPEMFFDDLVALHILVQLLVSKFISRLKNDHWGVSQEAGDLHRCIEDALDD